MEVDMISEMGDLGDLQERQARVIEQRVPSTCTLRDSGCCCELFYSAVVS